MASLQSTNGTLVCFSGGTAFDGAAKVLQQRTDCVTYVLPITDNGGSSGEILRCFGGPAVGDLRRRLLRLAYDVTDEARAVLDLLNHRLCSGSEPARAEWCSVVDGSHALWTLVPIEFRTWLQPLLRLAADAERDHASRQARSHAAAQCAASSVSEFDFQFACIGNMLFVGALLVFRTLTPVLFMLSRMLLVPHTTHVLAACESSDEPLTIGVELADGTQLLGQFAVSYSFRVPRPVGVAASSTAAASCASLGIWTTPKVVEKGLDQAPFPAPVRCLFYLNAAGERVCRTAAPGVIRQVHTARAIVYACGSLFTSIVACLAFEGMGEAIAAASVPKVMILNGSRDRETAHLTAAGCVCALASGLNRVGSPSPLAHAPSAFVTHLLVPNDNEDDSSTAAHRIPVSADELAGLGVVCVPIATRRDAPHRYDDEDLVRALLALPAMLARSHAHTPSG